MVPGSTRNWIAVNAVQQSSLNKKMKAKNMTTPSIRNSISRPPLRRGFLLVPLALALAWLVFSPTAQADCKEGCDLSNGNTFLGNNALVSNTTGIDNTAIGEFALFKNTTGVFNTANGNTALYHNTTGSENTATGLNALTGNTIGSDNTATGISALVNNTTGSENTATGDSALGFNTTGNNNTATGGEALFNNTGDDNTANGFSALLSNTTGNFNTANGFDVLNEFLKEHRAFLKEQRKVEAQEATITQLKQDFQFRLAKQQKQIEALTTGLQKVSEQLELSKSSQTVLNNQ